MNTKEYFNQFNEYLHALELFIVETEKFESNKTGGEVSNYLLNDNSIISNLQSSMNLLTEEISKLDIKLNIAVFGKFNSGKSTFINALIGKEIAIVDELEMTYTVNYITHGKSECACIVNYSGETENFNITELNSLLLKNRENDDFKKDIKHIEFMFDYPELQDINIWDTPGLGSTTEINRNTALSILEGSDVVLWIIDVDSIGDADDKSYLDLAIKMNKPLICVINKFDTLDYSPDARTELQRFMNDVYSNYFAKVFFISARDAFSTDSCTDELKSGILDIREYLSKNIFSKKRELVWGSTVNNIKNQLQNVEETIENFRDQICDKLDNFEVFMAEFSSKVELIAPNIQKIINRYIAAVVFENEHAYMINSASKFHSFSKEKIEEEIIKVISKDTIDRYIKELETIVKERLEADWHNVVRSSSRLIEEKDFVFNISKNSMLADKNENSVVAQQISQETVMKVSLTLASVVFLSVAATSAGIATAVAAGFLTLTTAVWGITNFFNLDDSLDRYKNNLAEVINKLKEQFNHEVAEQIFIPKINALEVQMIKNITSEAEAKIFYHSSRNEHIEEKNRIEAHVVLNSAILSKTCNIYDEVASNTNLFRSRIVYDNFIIERQNPNPGIDKLIQVLGGAEQFIYIVDPYFLNKSLDWLKHINSYIPVKVMTYYLDEKPAYHQEFLTKLKEFRENRKASLLVRLIKYKYQSKNQKGTPLHDRFIFTGSYGIQLGNGLDAIGKSDISVSFLKDHKLFRKKFFDEYWNAHTILFADKAKQIDKLDI